MVSPEDILLCNNKNNFILLLTLQQSLIAPTKKKKMKKNLFYEINNLSVARVLPVVWLMFKWADAAIQVWF